jgi:rod shape-determining protein MreB
MPLRGILTSTLYVRIRPNEFQVRHLESGREVRVQSQVPFTTQRLLVGNFIAAEDCLIKAFKEVRYGPRYLAAPTVVMHPLAMTEGGLSQIEARALQELAEGAGGKTSIVWEGHELQDAEVKARVRAV